MIKRKYENFDLDNLHFQASINNLNNFKYSV